MSELIEFLKGLFATDKWPARWHCGYWSDFHGWLYIISDLIVWLAYFAIPVIILNYFSKKRTGLNFQKIYLLFAVFILLCGSTHFLDALMFWWPAYRLNAVVRFATGVASIATVIALIKVLPVAFKMKTGLELEQEIARRIEAERQLAEANDGLRAFAYVASHDLQEPLRKINTYTSLLQEANASAFDTKSKGYAEKIATSSAKMQNLIKDVLNLSSINDNIDFQAVNLADAVEDAMDDLEVKILERSATIKISDMPLVKGNASYLSQLFMNLISNSIKFSKGRPIINIEGFERGNDVVIKLSDNGIGMEQDRTDKIFEPFHRLNSKQEYDGSGIGLAICKKIVDIHQGEIAVKSELGKGTTFLITLPKA